jgi:voltage-gated potassium channel
MNDSQPPEQSLSEARSEVLQQLEEWLDLPMLVLSFVWLALFVVELIWGLNPFLDAVSTTIWLLFIFNFLLEFTIAPNKRAYLQRNWITIGSLALPALRTLRIFRVVRAARGVRLLGVMTRTNRGMRTRYARAEGTAECKFPPTRIWLCGGFDSNCHSSWRGGNVCL